MLRCAFPQMGLIEEIMDDVLDTDDLDEEADIEVDKVYKRLPLFFNTNCSSQIQGLSCFLP